MRADYKSGFVTLIGRPNVGKSTLMNHLIGQKIAITSNKPQTTRNRIQTVLTTAEGQIVFVDTPGIHKAKNKLGEYMVNVAERTLNEVDVVVWLVEPSTFIGAGEKHIIEQLKKVKTPVILVINKVDMVKREEVFAFIDAYQKQYDFAAIVPVSARTGENTDELVNPNVGKSTLMNHLIGQKIAITSNKPQTTRNRIQTVLTTEEGQIVFVDTPGIHKAKNKLGEYMVNVAERTLNEVDVVVWLVEPSTFIGAGEKHIIEQLKKVKTPVILVINKVDMVKREEVFAFIDAYQKQYDFAAIVPVSARTGENTDELVKVLFQYLPYGPQFYDEDTITDQPQRQIVAEIIREKALHALNEEIPHGIAVAIDRMEFKRKLVNIDATIICERDSHKGIIIGKQGAMLKKIGSNARFEIEKMLEMQVNLKLWVKVKKDWRDSDFLIKNFGYTKDE